MTIPNARGNRGRMTFSVTVFGFDNHKPKGPHLHVGDRELGYLFRGYDELMRDIRKMIEQEGFIYEE